MIAQGILPFHYEAELALTLLHMPSSLLQGPVIGYIIVKGVNTEFVRLFVVIVLSDGVYHIGRLGAVGFEAMENEGRDVYEHGVVLAHEKLVDQSFGGRILSLVIEGNFCHTFNHHHVIGLILVIMPGFYYARIAGSDIYLTKFLKHGVIAAEHFHKLPSLIGYPPQLLYLDAVY